MTQYEPTAPTEALPTDIESERATLGSIILDRDAIIAVAPWLEESHFWTERHRLIYRAMLACYNRGVPPDLKTIAAELNATKRLDSVGGLSYLLELSNAVPTSVHIEHYARAVERTAGLRRLITAGGKIAALGYGATADLSAALDEAEAELFAVASRKRAEGFTPIEQIVDEWYGRIKAMMENGEPPAGLKSGFDDYDKLTGGLQKSDLIIIAARPAVGKTSLALNIAYHAALNEGAKVAIFSLEMSKDQLMQRMLATHTGVDMKKLRTGQIRDEDLHTLMDAMGVLSGMSIFIDDAPGVTPMDLRSRCRRLQAEVGVDLVVVDYIQLMTGSHKRDGNRVQEVSEISRGLKILARELNVPVIALSQLSRAVESRTDHIPLLSDLRESGSLEQDADQVVFIYREELYDPDTDKKGIAELHIAKHRNGPTGIVPLRFFKSTTRFASLETYRQPEGY